MPGDGAHIDDVAAVALNHAGEHCAGHVYQSLDVCVDHLLPIFNIPFMELRQPASESGIVHENVNLLPF